EPDVLLDLGPRTSGELPVAPAERGAVRDRRGQVCVHLADAAGTPHVPGGEPVGAVRDLPAVVHPAPVQARELATFDEVETVREAYEVAQVRLVDRAPVPGEVELGAAVLGVGVGGGDLASRVGRVRDPQRGGEPRVAGRDERHPVEPEGPEVLPGEHAGEETVHCGRWVRTLVRRGRAGTGGRRAPRQREYR